MTVCVIKLNCVTFAKIAIFLNNKFHLPLRRAGTAATAQISKLPTISNDKPETRILNTIFIFLL